MSTTTEYKLLDTDENGTGSAVVDTDGWKVYPADRRTVMEENSSNDLTFVYTGGNALQAIHKDMVRHKKMISVVVPGGKDPGDELLVACPFMNDRLLSVKIPEGAIPGSVFLVEEPDITPTIVTGIPVLSPNQIGEIPIVQCKDEFAKGDLVLQEENEEAAKANQTTSSFLDGEEYEMVEKRDIV